MKKKKIAIIGSGPSALIAADILSKTFEVTVYEKGKGIGQKFLIAGKGGLNITNSLQGKELAKKYFPNGFMDNAINAFDSKALRKWLNQIGVGTFVGSSGRVFPEKGIRTAEVLNKIKDKLILQNVKINLESEFIGFNKEQNPEIIIDNIPQVIIADYYIFALGGASWSSTGSDGKWSKYFHELGVNIVPFESSNCGVNIKWNNSIIKNHAGKPLKNISVSVGNIKLKGEAIITEYGLEGNVIYPLIPEVRKLLKGKLSTELIIDFKPDNTIEELLNKCSGKRISSKEYGKTFNLKREQLALIKNYSTKDEYLSLQLFVEKIKHLNIKVNSLRSIEESISTVGGIDINELEPDFSLKKNPKIFCIGEMVDWDAPTGGFLLQGTFSMGYYAAISILERE